MKNKDNITNIEKEAEALATILDAAIRRIYSIYTSKSQF